MGEFDVDVSDSMFESPSTNIPLSTPPAVDPSAATQIPEEYEINWNGKTIKAPREKALQWASQGYDYSQKMAAFKQEQEKFASERSQFDEVAGRYKSVDEFAKQNPDWWNHVEKSWEERQAQARNAVDPTDPVASELQSLKSTLAELTEFRNSVIAEKQEQQRQAQDTQLNQEITGIQKQYNSLDWTGIDENGLTLEMRVLQHAQSNNIPSFRAAFRDYYHDHLVTLAQSSRLENGVRNAQQARKEGLLGTTPTPKKTLTRAENVKNKSYGDLLAEGKAELGIN